MDLNKNKIFTGSAEMRSFMNLLLNATDAAATQVASPLPMLLTMVLMFVMMYFIIYRPQKKEQTRKAALLSSLEVGDSVLTTSGFYGIVIDVTDEDVIVEFGNNKNCRIPMKKAAIEQVEKPDKEML